MENISHFLRACQNPPLGLQAHDTFLTVDLYEKKDPAQVLQCIGAFSRKASTVHPSMFPTAIGGKKGGGLSPQLTGTSSNGGRQTRGDSNASDSNPHGAPNHGRTSPSKLGTTSPASSWAKKSDIGTAQPAWNIAQYGWTGGASQGNQGITFGSRRQLTTPGPHVPSLAEKERKRREAEAEAERLRVQADEAEQKRRVEREAEEERAQAEEARRWEEEAKRQREKERLIAEEERRKWQEDEKRWKMEEEARLKEEKELEARLEKDRVAKRAVGDARLHGQFLSQYQAEQRPKIPAEDPERVKESERVKELERQLEEAKKREAEYERERLRLQAQASKPALPQKANPTPALPARLPEEDSWQESERDYLRKEWSSHQPTTAAPISKEEPRPLPIPQPKAALPDSPTPSPHPSPLPSRPLPHPQTYTPRTAAFLTRNPAPNPSQPKTHIPDTFAHSTGAEVDAENARRLQSQTATKAGGWASKSLLEREMEMERQRQREWEEGQKQTQEAVARGVKVEGEGVGPGQSWDVNQYGFTGGDNLNKGAAGVYSGRRQIIGPRAMGSKPS
jgi:hypothetical protein